MCQCVSCVPVSGEVVGVREAGGCVCVSVCPVSCVRGGGGCERGRRVCVSVCVLCPVSGEVVGVREAGYLISPLEVVNRTAPGRHEELGSSATSVTMIWLVRATTYNTRLHPAWLYFEYECLY